MEIKRTTEISIEKTRRFRFRPPEPDAAMPCPVCGEPLLPAEAAAVLFRIKYRLIYQIVETGATHFAENETGAMFVCPQSINRVIGNNDEAPPAEIARFLAAPATKSQS